jgi:hypothetical protein
MSDENRATMTETLHLLYAARLHLWDYAKLLAQDGRAGRAEAIRQLVDRLNALIASMTEDEP